MGGRPEKEKRIFEKEKEKKMRVFVDTSAWIAFFNVKDDFHQEAKKIFKTRPSLITSNTVLHETIAHLSTQVSKKAARIAGDFIFSQAVELIILTANDELSSWEKLKKMKLKVSFVDITNAVLMERLNLKEIFAFDKDFEKMGLQLIP